MTGNIRENSHSMHFRSPIGMLCIQDDGEALTALFVDKTPDRSKDVPSPFLDDVRRQVEEYFAGVRTRFDVPLHMEGTPFRLKVWNALQEIKYGETCTYEELAQKVGNGKACRAVGGANNKNPILLIVPCHRVIGKDGRLVGFGAGIEIKEALLALEAQYIQK